MADNFCSRCGNRLVEGVCPACDSAYQPKDNGGDSIFDIATQKINELAGESGSVKLNISDLFSEVLKKHSTNESDKIFIGGTSETTPDEKDISSTWPKPWLYSRVFLAFITAFAFLYVCYFNFTNINALPGMVFIGAMMVPVPIMVFFMEVNAPRNISFIEVLKIFFVGGAASLVVTLFLFSFVNLGDGYIDAMMVGVIEETGKAVIIYWFLHSINKSKGIKFVLNGLLIGAAVGAGFAVYETAGYILRFGLQYGEETMMAILWTRSLLSPGGHIIWGAILGAALVLAKNGDEFSLNCVKEKKFLCFYAMCVVMHGVWDMPFRINQYIKLGALIIAAWIIGLVLIDVGLKEVSRINAQYTEKTPETETEKTEEKV